MKKTLPILLFLIFTGILAGQLKISQYPNTNNLASAQRFIVTAGGTNMNITWAQLLSIIGRDSTNFSSITVSNDMIVLGTMSMGTFNVNTIVVTNSVSAASGSFTNLTSTNASFGVLRGVLSVSNAANSQRHSYVDDGEGWQFFYGGDQWTFDPAASTGVPHRSEITANTNFLNASIGNGVVTNTIGYFYSVSNAWDATNFVVDVTKTLYIQSSNLVGLTNFANTETGNGTKIIYQNIIIAGVSNTPGEIRFPTNAQFGMKFRWMGTKPTYATNDASTWFSIAWRGTNATVAGATATGQ